MPAAAPDSPTVTISNRLTLAQAGRKIGKSPSCLFRWWSAGVRGVRLECLRFGRSLYTSEAALEQFARAVAQAAQDGPAAPADDDSPTDGL